MDGQERDRLQRVPCAVAAETSARITNMSLLCAFLVIMIHLPIVFESNVEVGLFAQMIRRITAIAVPFFFAVAGYFLAGHTHEVAWYSREVKKRIRSLLVPLWVTAVLLFVWNIPLILAANVYANTSLWRNLPQSVADWMAIVGLHPFENPLTPLWFLRTLFLFVLISPVLLKAVRWSKYAAIALLVVIWGAWIGFSYALSRGMIVKDSPLEEVLTWLFSLKNLFFFSAGLVLRYNPFQLPKLKGLRLIASVGVIGLSLWAAIGGVKVYLYLPLLIVCLYWIMPSKPWPKVLTSCAFPVYLLHMFVVSVMGIVIKNVSLFSRLHGNVVGWIVDCGIAFAICVLITCGLRRYFPRIAYWWFGGRGQ